MYYTVIIYIHTCIIVFTVRQAMSRRSSSHDQAIDDIDSPNEGFENGTLAIKPSITPRGSISGTFVNF